MSKGYSFLNHLLSANVTLVNKYCTFITRYRLQFDRESKGEIEARKKAAQEPLKYVSEVCLIILL